MMTKKFDPPRHVERWIRNYLKCTLFHFFTLKCGGTHQGRKVVKIPAEAKLLYEGKTAFQPEFGSQKRQKESFLAISSRGKRGKKRLNYASGEGASAYAFASVYAPVTAPPSLNCQGVLSLFKGSFSIRVLVTI